MATGCSSHMSPIRKWPQTLGQGSPGGSVVKNPPASAEDMDLILKIPHASGPLNPRATTTEPVL